MQTKIVQTFLNDLQKENQKEKAKKQDKIVYKLNKRKDFIYNFGIEKVYNLSELHSLINWYKYYLDYNLNELIYKYEVINNNKISL